MIGSVVLLSAAGLVAWLGASAFARIEFAAARIARRRWLTTLLAAVMPLGLRLALLPVFSPPAPQAQDEFSHLLAADTFAHGRLTNPQPPLAIYFESMHILVRPSYSSIYPPAHGMVMALGKVITGNTWAGVLLSVALMNASICWMLQAWVPPVWALAGTSLLIIRLSVFSYWINSYWGGAVAACGGALVLGTIPRLIERRSIADSMLLGSGIAILANSRPFEGAIFTALSLCLLAYKADRTPILWPAIPILLLTIAGFCYYWCRITGNPFLPPYVLYRTTAAIAPHFTFLHPSSALPHWNYAVLRTFYESEMQIYEAARARPFLAALVSAEVYWRFYVSVLLSLPLVAAFRERGARRLFGVLAIFVLLALAPQVWHSPHYAAPATGLVFLLVTFGMRRLRSWSVAGRRLGPWLTRTLLIATVMFTIRLAGSYAVDTAGSRWSGWAAPAEGSSRAAVLRRLAPDERHLVVVRHGAQHNPNQEWVYNEADIDHAPVVWVRDRGPFDNRDIVRHFKERRIWLLEPDRTPPRLSVYPSNLMVEPEELARRIRGQACGPDEHGPCAFSCDQWNFFFSRVTQLEAPNVLSGCTDADRRADKMPFDTWLMWLRAQH